MNRYTPIWDRLPDSSVWEEPYHVRILWITMLSLKDRDHVVRYDAYGLRKRANITDEETAEGLKVLSDPDRRRPGQEDGGRRIEKHAEGWLILNGEKYQNMMREANRRAYKADWQREKRGGGVKSGPLPNEGVALGASDRGDEAGYDALAAERPERAEKLAGERALPEAPEAPEVLEAPKSGNSKLKCWSLEARVALAHLNEAAGRHFRETDVNLRLIQCRLDEVKGDLPGVRMMIDRMVMKWRGTEYSDFLRPETLFRQSRFGGYYDDRDIPIAQNENDKRVNTRNVGTCEVTTDFAAAAARRSPDYQRSLLEQQMAPDADRAVPGVAGT